MGTTQQVRKYDDMWQSLKILVMIMLPLVWGLGSDYLFARLRSRGQGSRNFEEGAK